jgi:hypothetical protein
VDVEDPLGTFEIVLARISDEETRSISIQTEEVFDQGLNAKDEGVTLIIFLLWYFCSKIKSAAI